MNLNLDLNDVRTILSALQEVPYKTSDAVINKVIAQVEEQQKKEVEAVSETPKKASVKK